MSEYDLYQGDCLHKLPLLSDKSIDLVLTDPPYNIAQTVADRGNGLKGLRDNRLVDAEWDKFNGNSFAQLITGCFQQLAPKMRVGGYDHLHFHTGSGNNPDDSRASRILL